MIPAGYDLDARISSSDSAQVWFAMDPTGAPIVLKLASTNSKVRQRFKREIEALEVAAGPHVMPVLDYDDSFSWYSMPIATQTLYATNVPVSFAECLLILETITAALRPIHSLGQVHRDLKPQNILLLDDGDSRRWVVGDFGIVRNAPGKTTDQLTRTDDLTGTEGWAAPEQYRDAHLATITADVFGAGGIFSWMLTGRQPSFGSVMLPTEPRLKAVIRRATNSDSTKRYSDLDGFLEAVKDSMAASSTSFESLVDTSSWKAVGAYILGQPSHLPRVVAVLPKLRQPIVNDWFGTDPAGLVSAVSEALEELNNDRRGISFGDIDSFLSWGVTVLRVLVNKRDYDSAEQIATQLFGVTASIGQFKPARKILEWLAHLNKPAQQAIETALHSSSSLEFFRSQASNQWPKPGENDLMQRLREE